MSINSKTIGEGHEFFPGISSADISPGPVDGAVFYDAQEARRVAAAFQTSTVADTETTTVTLLQATDAGGTAKKVLGTAKVITAPAGGGVMRGVVDEEVSKMDHENGFVFVGVRLENSEDASAIVADALIIFGELRHAPAVNANA
jgi:hypothetical protein